jgi:hypothetical protein
LKDNDIGAEDVRIMSEMFASAILEREVKEERMDDYEPLTTPNVQTAVSTKLLPNLLMFPQSC